MKNVVYFGKCKDGPLGPTEGVKVCAGGPWGKKSTFSLSPEVVGGFSSNLVEIIPRVLEHEVVHMGHVALGVPGEWPPGKNELNISSCPDQKAEE